MSDELPHTRFSRAVERGLGRAFRAASWLWIGLVAIVTANVGLRAAFGLGSIFLEELQWHVYAVGFLLGLADGVARDTHVRIDVLRGRFGPVVRAWIELYGLALLVVPFLVLVLASSVPFALDSFRLGEVSGAPGGLPARWAIKSVLPLAFALLLVATAARLLRVTSFLFGAPRPLPPAEDE